MDKSLKYFQNEYEKLLHSDLTDQQKGIKYGSIMTEMEQVFHIPMIRDKAWEQENRKVIALYRKIAKSRRL